jgi:hypothetical protein
MYFIVTIETRSDQQQQQQRDLGRGKIANHPPASIQIECTTPTTMPLRPPTVEDAFDDETDLPLPSRALPNTGTHGALLEEVASDDEMEIPTEPTQKPSSRSKPPESRPAILKHSPEFEKMKR